MLCAIHCALTPLLIAALPLLGKVGGWWSMLDIVFLFVSLVAVWGTVRSATLVWIRRSVVLGWLVLAVGLACERSGIAGSDYIMYLGAAGLLVAHVANIRHCRRCEYCSPYA